MDGFLRPANIRWIGSLRVGNRNSGFRSNSENPRKEGEYGRQN